MLLAALPSLDKTATATAPIQPVISSIIVEVAEHPDLDKKIEHLVRSLVGLKKGDRFAPKRLEYSLEALRLTGRFESIHADTIEDQNRFDLHLRVTPFPLIKNIRYHQISPIFQREIKKVLTLTVGAPLQTITLSRNREALVRLYRNQGFIAPIVDIEVQADPKDGNCVVHLRLDKGPYYRLGRSSFKGNRSVSILQLKRRMRTWRRSWGLGVWGRFIEDELIEDVKTLTTYFRKKKYADARIGYKLVRDKPTRSVHIDIEIDQGPLYRLEFVGNDKISALKLMREVTLFTRGNSRNRGIRQSMQNLKKQYHRSGFLGASIEIEDKTFTEGTTPTRLVRFKIKEGPQTIVREVAIKGNKALPTDALKANILTRPAQWNHAGVYVPNKLNEDIEALRFLYAENGYRQPQITVEKAFDTSRENVNLTFFINEGIQTRVNAVSFNGLKAVTRQEALAVITLKPETPFQEFRMTNDENSLKALIATKGYPRVKISSEYSLSPDSTRAMIIYYINAGTLKRLGNIHYQGNFKTRRKVLDREWALTSDEPLNPRLLLESENNIRRLGIINSAKTTPVQSGMQNERVDMVVALEEQKPYFFEFSGGYESDRRFFTAAKVADRNLFGLNNLGWALAELSEIGYRLETGIREPRLFGFRLAANFHGYIEKQERFNQDFGTDKAGATLGFEATPAKQITTGFNLKYEYLDLFNKNGSTPIGDIPAGTDPPDKPRNVIVGTPRIQYDSRDSFIRPRKGLFALADIDISRGLRNDLDDFLRYRLDLRYFWTPVKPLTFAFIGRGGYLDPYNRSDLIPKDQLFYLGGTTDIRGYKQNAMLTNTSGDAVGGEKSLYAGLEARIGLGTNWEVPLFVDLGWLGGIATTEIEADIRFSVGTGLRYVTPIGPIGILYGYKLDRQPGEAVGAFHFSLGYTF